jgi:hypothetical protein
MLRLPSERARAFFGLIRPCLLHRCDPLATIGIQVFKIIPVALITNLHFQCLTLASGVKRKRLRAVCQPGCFILNKETSGFFVA